MKCNLVGGQRDNVARHGVRRLLDEVYIWDEHDDVPVERADCGMM